MSIIALGLGTLSAGAGLVLSGTTLSVATTHSIVIAGAGNGSLQLSGDAASPGNNYVYATDGAGAKGWRALSAFGVTTVAGTAGQVLVNGAATAASGAVTLTLAAALTSITSVTAGTATALTLTGGDTGASISLGAGATGMAKVNVVGGKLLLHTFSPVGSEAPNGNLFIGIDAGNEALTAPVHAYDGSYNACGGWLSGNALTTGFDNAAWGSRSLEKLTTGVGNAAFGAYALQFNVDGSTNTAVGDAALNFGTTGSYNTAGGYLAAANTTGNFNTTWGWSALKLNTTGAANVAIGAYAGDTETPANANVSGTLNTWVGHQSGPGTATQLTNASAFGYQAHNTASNQVVLGNADVTSVFTYGALTIGATLNYPDSGGNSFVIQSVSNVGYMRAATSGGVLKFRVNGDNTDTLVLNADQSATFNSTITASGTGTHTFGTTNTVTIAAGVVTSSTTTPKFSLVSTTEKGYLHFDGTNVQLVGLAGDTKIYAANTLTATFSGANTTLAGNLTASGTGTHTFGTTTTVTMTAGVLAANAVTEATTGAAGAITTLGGIYATKRIITATDLFVTGGQSWGITSTATAAGTTTLTNASKTVQILTGTTTQTVQLPAANATGAGYAIVYVIKNRSTSTITVLAAGTDTIDATTSITLASNEAAMLTSNGTNAWVRI